MRILARTSGIRYSPLIALVLALGIVSLAAGQRVVWRGLAGAADAGQSAVETIRYQVEPAIFVGGLLVSRSRHVIAGAAMGCTAGAAVGAGGAAIVGVATGGAGLAALPAAAGIGCLAGAAGGIALGYPLDSWSLALE